MSGMQSLLPLPLLFSGLFPLALLELQPLPSCLPLASAAVHVVPKGGGGWLLESGDNLLGADRAGWRPCFRETGPAVAG